MLEFNVQNQIIKRTDSLLPVADSRNYLKAEFKVTDEWQGAIAAVFGYGKSFYRVLLDNDNCCIVPWEVIKAPQFTVSLYCEGESLITSNTAEVLVEPSGMKEGAQPTEPTSEIWQQYMLKMQQNIENAVPYIGENGNWYFYDVELGGYTDSGMLAAPEKGVDYWTEADKEEIQRYIDKQVGAVETSLEEHSSYATSQRGYLENLSTTDNSNLVAAINEVDGKIDDITPFVVNFTKSDDGTITADHSLFEIQDAYAAQKNIICYLSYRAKPSSPVFVEQFYYIGNYRDNIMSYAPTPYFASLRHDSYSCLCCDTTLKWTLKTYSVADKNYVDEQTDKAELITNRVMAVNAESDHEHYPTAEAVFRAVDDVKVELHLYADELAGDIETALDGIIAIQNQLMGVSE